MVSEAIGVLREAMRTEDIVPRMRAAQAVLRTSGIQTAMKTEQPPSKEEMMIEFLSEMIGKAAKEIGVDTPLQIGSGK